MLPLLDKWRHTSHASRLYGLGRLIRPLLLRHYVRWRCLQPMGGYVRLGALGSRGSWWVWKVIEVIKVPSVRNSVLTTTRYSSKTKKLAVTLASFCYSKSTHLAAYYTTIRLFFITVVPGRICNSNNGGCDIKSNASISSNFFRQSNTISTVNSWLITESLIFICASSSYSST